MLHVAPYYIQTANRTSFASQESGAHKMYPTLSDLNKTYI